MIKIRTFIFFIIPLSLTTAQDQGIMNYQKQNYKAAEKYYDSILANDKKNSEAHYGKGATLYMQDDVKSAEIKFNESLYNSGDKLKSKALYNLGNISYKNNNLSEALEYYKKALELNPDDDEAKYNYEFIKYQKKPEEEKNDQENNEEKKDEEKKDEEKKDEEKKDEEDKDEKKDEEEKKDENKNEDEQEDKDNDEESKDESQSQSEQQNEKKSQDLKKAESILDALKNDEKVMQKQQLQKFKSKKLLKDW